MSRRYEHASTVLTSNKSFEEWGEVFGDEVMAAALIDRLVHHCHIVNIRGNSYRMRHHADLRSALTPGASPPARRWTRVHQDGGPAAGRRRRAEARPPAECAIHARRKCAISTAVDNRTRARMRVVVWRQCMPAAGGYVSRIPCPPRGRSRHGHYDALAHVLSLWRPWGGSTNEAVGAVAPTASFVARMSNPLDAAWLRRGSDSSLSGHSNHVSLGITIKCLGGRRYARPTAPR